MVVEYLSPEWIEAADELLASAPTDGLPDGEPLVVETVVTDAPGGERRYVVELGASGMSARRSDGTGPFTVRLTQSYEVAAEVAQGRLSAQAAFLDARIQLGGDVTTLIGNADLVARIGDVLAPLRSRTSYPAAGD